ncbi:MAG: hypothetical protein M3P43_11125 [Actinomycetota bacterium]|nr:hypothetical protein [Actinomycetota bacterium]
MRRTTACLAALVLVSTACSHGPSSTQLGAATGGVPSPSVAPAAPTDPLEGDWRQVFMCEDVIQTLQAHAKPAWFDKWIADIIRGMEGAKDPPPQSDLCAGAPATFERIIRFRGGRVVFFDPRLLQGDGLNAIYELRGDHTFVVTDTQGNISGLRGDGVLRCTFRFQGDQLTIHERSRDPWDLSGFQAGPLVRIS